MSKCAEEKLNKSKKRSNSIGLNSPSMKSGMKIHQTGLKHQHPLKKEERKVKSIEIGSKETPSMYKNYIYRGKNWECPICGAEDHCGHYHCTQCQGIHPKDRSYRMRL